MFAEHKLGEYTLLIWEGLMWPGNWGSREAESWYAWLLMTVACEVAMAKEKPQALYSIIDGPMAKAIVAAGRGDKTIHGLVMNICHNFDSGLLGILADYLMESGDFSDIGEQLARGL